MSFINYNEDKEKEEEALNKLIGKMCNCETTITEQDFISLRNKIINVRMLDYAVKNEEVDLDFSCVAVK